MYCWIEGRTDVRTEADGRAPSGVAATTPGTMRPAATTSRRADGPAFTSSHSSVGADEPTTVHFGGNSPFSDLSVRSASLVLLLLDPTAGRTAGIE